MRRAIGFVRRACEGPRKNQIDAEKIKHTQPCFSSAFVMGFRGLFSLPGMLCTVRCASVQAKSFFSFVDPVVCRG
jgi:hypothetical protein